VVASPTVRRECELGFDALLSRARTGDEHAWAHLYDSLAPQVLGYLRARGATDAEEVLGDVFLHVARGMDGFSGDAAGFRSWVFVIATSRLHDERRRARRKPTTPLDQSATEDQLSSSVDVEQQVEEAAVVQELHEMLRVLTAEQRAVVELRVFAGLSSQEVSEVVGKPVGAVKALYRRGLGSLRRHLELGGQTSSSPSPSQLLAFRRPAVPVGAASAVTGGS